MSWAEIVTLLVVGGTAVWATLALPPLHPAQLWSVPWAAALALFALRLFPYRRLSVLTCGLIVGAVLLFVIGTLIGDRYVARSAKDRSNGADMHVIVSRAATAALSITALLLAGYLWQTIRRFGLHDALVSSSNVRLAIARGAVPITIKFVYSAFASACLAASALATVKGKWRKLGWSIAVAVAVGCLYFATGRGTLVFGLIIASVAYVMARPRLISRRRFLLAIGGLGVIAVLVNVAGGQIIGKTYANNPDFHTIRSVFSRNPSISDLAQPYEYATAPIAALDIQVKVSALGGTSHGCAMFSEECSVMHRLGLPVKPVPRIRPFTSAPLAWNTYTGLDLPLQDFGFLGALPIVVLAGIVMGLLWHSALLHRPNAVLLYPIGGSAVVAGYSQFNFTAPQVLGAMFITAGLLVLSTQFGRRFPWVNRAVMRKATSIPEIDPVLTDRPMPESSESVSQPIGQTTAPSGL